MQSVKYGQITSKNVIVGYININSVRNKFEHFSQMIRDKLDVLIIAETKLDSSFPSSQFTINGFKAPIRLDITRNSGGLLVYSREDILCRKIEGLEIPKDIQAIPIEINIRKQKWLLLPIYRSPTQDPCYFVDNVCRIIDGYALSRENVLLIGDFNMEVGDRALSPLIVSKVTYLRFQFHIEQVVYKDVEKYGPKNRPLWYPN